MELERRGLSSGGATGDEGRLLRLLPPFGDSLLSVVPETRTERVRCHMNSLTSYRAGAR